jgi:hypothetical protein
LFIDFFTKKQTAKRHSTIPHIKGAKKLRRLWSGPVKRLLPECRIPNIVPATLFSLMFNADEEPTDDCGSDADDADNGSPIRKLKFSQSLQTI